MLYGPEAELTPAMLWDATDGYSPCPVPIIEILKTWVLPSELGGTLYDNCAGDGVAANSLSQAWGLRPRLVEPHPGRYSLCLRYDREAILAPAQHVVGSGPTVWFFNPPYDPADQAGSMERHMLWSGISSVPEPGTLCVWLLPRRLLDDELFEAVAGRNLEALRVFRFPEAWEDYSQVVIFGYWVASPLDAVHEGAQSGVFQRELPALSSAPRPYTLNSIGADFSISAQFPPIFRQPEYLDDIQNVKEGAV